MRSDPAYLRAQVYKRDLGICAICGANAAEYSTRPYRAGHLWQADHIVPVVEGGGECDLSNMRTLCTTCHRAETTALRKRLAPCRIALATTETRTEKVWD
jgi:5-methylcytosine-specific restriction endonuclease McrA